MATYLCINIDVRNVADTIIYAQTMIMTKIGIMEKETGTCAIYSLNYQMNVYE